MRDLTRSCAAALLVLATAALAATPAGPPPPGSPVVPAAPPSPTVPAAPARPTPPPPPAAPGVPAAPAAPAIPKAPAPPDASTPTKSAKPSAERPQDSLTLTGPSVVIFHGSRADVARTEPETDAEKEERLALRKEFEGGASKLQDALRAHPHIKVIVSSADVVRFSDAKVPPVWRYSLGTGYGYVYYQPGKPLRVFSGVRSADGLICEASRLFDTRPRPSHCDP